MPFEIVMANGERLNIVGMDDRVLAKMAGGRVLEISIEEDSSLLVVRAVDGGRRSQIGIFPMGQDRIWISSSGEEE